MERTCLIVGAAGQVGLALSAELEAAGWAIARATRTPRGEELYADLTDPASLDAMLDEVDPDVVAITGAFTWVDGAEQDPATCFATNVEGPERIARWAANRDAAVVYYSTDHVFDGLDSPYVVGDSVQPLNVYAESKVRAEEMLRRVLPQGHLVIRTAWVYGPDERQMNFAIRLVKALGEGVEVRIPADQWGTPTWAPDVARVTRDLLEAGERGIHHVVGPDYVNRLELSQKVAEIFGLDPTLLKSISTPQLGQTAARPLAVRLDCGPGFHAKWRMLGVGEGLQKLKRWYQSSQSTVMSGSRR